MLNTCSDNIEDPESLEVSNALEKYTGLKVRLYLFHCFIDSCHRIGKWKIIVYFCFSNKKKYIKNSQYYKENLVFYC